MKIYNEYRYNVEYHIGFAKEAYYKCSAALREFNWHLTDKSNEVFVRSLNFDGVVWYGDIAVRESNSALDAALALINYISSTGLNQSKLRWKSNNPKESLKNALLKKQGTLEAVSAIDKIYSSIGFELLTRYRDWTTHRGAPRINADKILENGVVAIPPAEISYAEKPEDIEWAIESYLEGVIPEHTQIHCYPFVPPVAQRFGINVAKADKDIDIPGVAHIAKGAEGIRFTDINISNGSMKDNAEDYLKRNSILLHNEKKMIAGEELATYTGSQYVNSIGSVVLMFADSSLRNELDRAVLRLYQTLT